MKNKLLPIALLALAVSAGVDAAESKASPLRDKVAAKHKVLEQGAWNGRNRIAFEFGGRKAWIVEPSNAPRNGMPWTWTFHWPDLDVERTGVVAMLDDGYHHAYIDLFDTRMDDAGVAAAAAFQEYLVKELGFAPKANLIGLGWGGFMAARYAALKPETCPGFTSTTPYLPSSDTRRPRNSASARGPQTYPRTALGAPTSACR